MTFVRRREKREQGDLIRGGTLTQENTTKNKREDGHV